MMQAERIYTYVSSIGGVYRFDFSLHEVVEIYLAERLSPRAQHIKIDYELVNSGSLKMGGGVAAVDGGAVNLQPEFDMIRIIARSEGDNIYDKLSSVDDVVGGILTSIVKRASSDQKLSLAAYSFSPLASYEKISRPSVEGEFRPSLKRKRRPGFQMREIDDGALKRASIDDWYVDDRGVDGARVLSTDAPAIIFLRPTVTEQLKQKMPMSSVYEEGGFLLGRPFEQSDSSDRYLIDVAKAVPAENTAASFSRLSFTSDSFTALKKELATSYKGLQILGWYHSHLFPATDEFGLSGHDVEFHKSTFRQPWQVAGLINLEDNGSRVLRFYGPSGKTLAECPMVEVMRWPAHDDENGNDHS